MPDPTPDPGEFFICRPMTILEWLALPPKQRGSTEDMDA